MTKSETREPSPRLPCRGRWGELQGGVSGRVLSTSPLSACLSRRGQPLLPAGSAPSPCWVLPVIPMPARPGAPAQQSVPFQERLIGLAEGIASSAHPNVLQQPQVSNLDHNQLGGEPALLLLVIGLYAPVRKSGRYKLGNGHLARGPALEPRPYFPQPPEVEISTQVKGDSLAFRSHSLSSDATLSATGCSAPHLVLFSPRKPCSKDSPPLCIDPIPHEGRSQRAQLFT